MVPLAIFAGLTVERCHRDEIWQLYAYQKDYFQVSPDVVTFKGGRLGIGTLEPKAPLDVMGFRMDGATPSFL